MTKVANDVKVGDRIVNGRHVHVVSSVGSNSMGNVVLRCNDDTASFSYQPDELVAMA